MADGTASLGEGRMLDPALLPARNLLVTGDTEILDLFHEETLMGTAVRLVAVRAPALGNWLVDDRLVFLTLYLTVASGAQRTRTLAQQSAVAGRMRVMAGSALPVLDRCVLDSDVKRVVQIVAAETDLLFVDFVSRWDLGRAD
jgi:hypothetical protein